MEANDAALTASGAEQAMLDSYHALSPDASATVDRPPGSGVQIRPADGPLGTFDPNANGSQRPGLDALAASVAADNRVANVYRDKKRLDI